MPEHLCQKDKEEIIIKKVAKYLNTKVEIFNDL